MSSHRGVPTRRQAAESVSSDRLPVRHLCFRHHYARSGSGGLLLRRRDHVLSLFSGTFWSKMLPRLVIKMRNKTVKKAGTCSFAFQIGGTIVTAFVWVPLIYPLKLTSANQVRMNFNVLEDHFNLVGTWRGNVSKFITICERGCISCHDWDARPRKEQCIPVHPNSDHQTTNRCLQTWPQKITRFKQNRP